MGRKSILTDDVKTRVTQFVAAGAPIPVACEASGLSWNTAKMWFTPEYRDRQPYKAFVEGCAQAKARWAAAATMRVVAAGKGGAHRPPDWKADAWLLERRLPEHFSTKQSVELSGADGAPIELSAAVRYVVHVPDDEKEE